MGICLDPNPTMETQVAAHFHLRRIAQLHPYLDVGALMTLIYALVISRIDYFSSLYVGLPLRLMQRLQMVQNLMARLITGVKKFQHISPTLATLHWLSVHFRINFKVMMITFKALNSLGPQYLSERLLPARSVHNTCSSQVGRLRTLTPNEARREITRN